MDTINSSHDVLLDAARLAESSWDLVTGIPLNNAVLYLMNYWYQYVDIESSENIPRAKHSGTHID